MPFENLTENHFGLRLISPIKSVINDKLDAKEKDKWFTYYRFATKKIELHDYYQG